MMNETLTAEPEPIAAEAKLAKDLPLIPVTRHWNTFGDGRFNDPNNWLPSGIPTGDDTVSFEIGGSLTFTVTFPGNLLGELPATYTTNKLRVRGDRITFSGSIEVNRDDATYTVASTDMSEAGRGIIIGVDAGNTAVLDVSPASPSGLGLARFNCAAATLGEAAGSTGTMNVNFGAFNVTGSDFTATQLIVGNHGTGTLNISNGAKLNVPGFNSRVVLGNNAASVGSITVSGAGSTWTNANQLWVGGSGSGTLIIQRGGRLRCTSSAGSAQRDRHLPRRERRSYDQRRRLDLDLQQRTHRRQWREWHADDRQRRQLCQQCLGFQPRRHRHQRQRLGYGHRPWLDLEHGWRCRRRQHGCRRIGGPKRRPRYQRQKPYPRPQHRFRSGPHRRRRVHLDRNKRAADHRLTRARLQPLDRPN